MDIESARKLKYGDRVHCPADRGDPAYVGTVRSVDCGTTPLASHMGKEFIWVLVRQPGPRGHRSVWPSNRLGKA